MQIGRRQLGVQFGWNGRNSAYQNLQMQRSRIGNYLSNTRSALNSIGSALTSAANNKISGMANLAGQAAMDRIKAQISDTLAAREKQLNDAQAAIESTQAKINANSLSTPQIGSVLDTSA